MVDVDLSGARTLVAGATGVLGGAIARALHAEGARLALAGRNEQTLAALAGELGGVPSAAFDALDLERCGAAVGRRPTRSAGWTCWSSRSGSRASAPATRRTTT